MTGAIPLWVELVVSVLLVASGLLALAAALGLLRLTDFAQRMHPPALAYTIGAWCVTLASIIYFSTVESRLALHAWLVIILLCITAPITTGLLARAALFRQRAAAAREPGGNGPRA